VVDEQQPGADARSRAEQSVLRAERALRDGRAELAESRERAERLRHDPQQRAAPDAGTATPAELRADAVAFRERLGLAPAVPAPRPADPDAPRPADPDAPPAEDEPFEDTAILYRP
jgi:hypothetical protein